MAFVCAIDEDSQGVELTVRIDGDNAYAHICLGHDDETDAIYNVFVHMPPYLPRPNGRDIHFSIVETVIEDGEELVYEYRDGQETRFLDATARRIALWCVVTATNALALQLQPDTIVMTTITENLPKKALDKYWTICRELRDVGYDGRRDSPFLGTQIWIMSRITDET